MEQVNVFHKGIVSDIDYSKRDNLTWDFPTEGIRVINKKGQGLVITNMDGNQPLFEMGTELVDGVEYPFYAIGAKDINGIIYIISYNYKSTKGEIGTYPSPNYEEQILGADPTFVKEYKALNNYKLGEPFRTTSFNFDMDHPMDILLKQSYDDSVDIYLCDGKNPNRVINSGFSRTGQINGRYYNAEAFNGVINHIPSTLKIPSIVMSSVEGGGALYPGTHFAFIRYCTQDFARTKFLNTSGPIVVYENSTPNEIKGVQENDWTTGTPLRTNKKFTLQLSNLDPTYKYFEIALLRYSADSENGPAAAHYGLLDQRFRIDSSLSSQYITITGFEQQLAIEMSDIYSERIPYDISKTIDEVSDRYIGTNWRMRNEQYNVTKFAEFFSLVTLQEAYSEDLFDKPGWNDETHDAHNDGNAYLYGMLDYTHASNYVGYFRGQIYPFAARAIFDDNTVTDAFPCKGNIDGNTKGLFKFSDWVHGGSIDRSRTLGIQFNFNPAKSYYDANPSVFAHVIGFELLRGDRIDNLIGQGILLPMYDSIMRHQTGSIVNHGINQEGDDYDEASAYSIPLIYGAMPMRHYINETDPVKLEYVGIYEQISKVAYYDSGWDINGQYNVGGLKELTSKTIRQKKKFGLFMPDLFFEQNPYIPDDTFIEPVVIVSGEPDPDHGDENEFYHPIYARGIFWPNQGDMKERITPAIAGFEHRVKFTSSSNLEYTNAITATRIPVKSAIIDRFAWKGTMNMKSWLKPDDVYTEPENEKEKLSSRSYVVNKYIGIYCTETAGGNMPNDNTLLEPYIYGTVNLYKNANTLAFAQGVVQSFNVASQLYKPISPFISISSPTFWQSWKLPYYFQGDCYYNKTWFRHGRWFSYEGANIERNTNDYIGDGADFSDWRASENRCWQYGSLLGIITENKFNTAARNTVSALDNNSQEIEMTYFPKCLSDFGDWVQWTILRDKAENEAFQINKGYNQTLTEKVIAGYDSALVTNIEYRKTNRHYFSEKHVLGSFTDGWRDIKPSYFKDFAPQFGEIIAGRSIGNYLCSIMENAIIRHFIDDRELKSDDNSTRIILGTSYGFLSDNFVQIASFGSLHKHGLVKSDRAIYGCDMKRGIIWVINPVSSPDGGAMLVADDLTERHGITSWLDEIRRCYIGRPEFETVKDTTPILYGNGLSGGYNKKYKEVYLTWSWQNKKAPCTGRTDKTLIYSESLNAFTGTAPFASMMYMNLDTEFLKATHIISGSSSTPTGEIRYHDAEGVVQQFDGIITPVTLTIIINGLTGEGSLSNFEKIYEALRIIMTKVWLTCIRYETESQIGIYTFRTAECGDEKFWEHSEYLEGAWNIPVIVQTSQQPGEYYHLDYTNDSEIRGKYLKLTLTYHPTEQAEAIIIRSITTAFTPSIS